MKKFILLLFIAVSISFDGVPCWFTNIDDAVAEAKSSNKRVMVLFTGSDWCPPCINLEKYILSSNEFKVYANKNLVLVKIDFPKRNGLTKEQEAYNHRVQTLYKIEGYPTAIILNSLGKRISTPNVSWISKQEFMNNIK